LLDVVLEQDGAELRARWFRPNAGMAKTYAKGNLVALAGTLRRGKDGSAEMVHPRNVTALLAEEQASGTQSGLGLRPRYPTVEKVPGRVVEKLVAVAVERAAGLVPDVLPHGVAQRFGFPPIAESLRQVHRPETSLSDDKLAELLAGHAPAQRRLAFEDLFVVQVGLALERGRARHAPGWRCPVDSEAVLASARAALPFAPTSAQERAIRTVFADLTSAMPMQRLLQGDVGSGKTAVVFAAALLVARAGGQSLLMAPTEVLAEQHGRTLADWGNKAGLRVAVLHAGLDAQARRGVLAAVASGATDLLVGTHALLEESLRVKHLALAIVDEQHRFGVRQRAALRRAGGWIPDEKTGMVPHLLVLSATPIPRSLALTAYGDLDLVTLDESPPGRQIVATHLGVGEDARRAAMAAVKAAVAAGGQGFVVCPAIVEGKQGRRASVLSRFRELRPLLAPARVGLLHGQMPSCKQSEVVTAFRAGQLDVLVATTVLEVGVDVPRASIIVIEDAERFGLAQLHGRVGRAGQASSCHLLSGAQDPEILDRLAFVAATSDGFSIAEEDLRRRGPGEIYGERQTGVVGLWMRDPAGIVALVERARQEAEALLAKDPELASLEYVALRQAVESRWLRRRPIAEEAG
jgi:ATP-dependent DNA helicase RecG